MKQFLDEALAAVRALEQAIERYRSTL